MIAFIRSLAFYLAFYGGSVLFVIAAMVALPVSSGRVIAIATLWSNYHRWCVEALLGLRVRVTGTRPEGPALVAIKHESFFEAMDLPTMLDFPAAFAKKQLFDIPGWGRAARTYGAIPVDRGAGAKALRAMVKDARPFVEAQRPLVIFPEGTRAPPGQRPHLRSGFAALYKVLGLPVVPVAVNSGKTYHKLWKPSGEIEIRFGDPIAPGLPREEIERRVHEAINALND